MNEIEKIKFHLALLAESLDTREQPIPALVISLDWSRENLNSAHDIFQRYDDEIDKFEVPVWSSFEQDLLRELRLDYQGIKSVILAFYRNQQWVDVCTAYALANPCVEFYEITRGAHQIYEQAVANIIGRQNIIWNRNFMLPLGNNTVTEVDFFFNVRDERIIVEAKSAVTERDANNFLVKWKNITEKKAADKLWIITDHCSKEAGNILGRENIVVMSKNELQKFLPELLRKPLS